MSWVVYLLRCCDGTLYCGMTNDLARRLKVHGKGGVKYTRGRLPVAVAHVEPVADRSSALRREAAWKRLTRQAKLHLIEAAGLQLIDSAGLQVIAAAGLQPIAAAGLRQIAAPARKGRVREVACVPSPNALSRKHEAEADSAPRPDPGKRRRRRVRR